MGDAAKPFLGVYVVWHPGFDDGPKLAETIRKHFRCGTFEDVSSGAGVSVVYRSETMPGSMTPLGIDFEEAETTAIVVLSDSGLVGDHAWIEYVRGLANRAEDNGLSTRVFPVSVEAGVIERLGLSEQALRWDKWTGSETERRSRLAGELTYHFCRMLRHYLEHLKHPAEEEAALERYLRKIKVFLSHSKHDNDGARIAEAVRDRIHERHALASFFDVCDIPAGLRFHKVLIQQIRVSAVVAVHTDSYSSREWCRREVIEAKLRNVPLIVANCINNLDDRSFPYMGNVPVVRVDDREEERIDFLIGCLLDEVLRDFLWRCMVRMCKSQTDSSVTFLPRPPELISLAALPQEPEKAGAVIVYPDPPISNEEESLFARVAPQVRLLSLMEWTAESFQ